MNIIKTISGEHSVNNRSRNRVYFFCIKNGIESSIKNNSILKIRNFEIDKDTKGNREIKVSYNYSNKNILIKMVCMYSALGKLKQSAEIFINIDAGLPIIKIKGYDDFGLYEGVGEINTRLTKVSIENLKKDFEYEVLSAPEKSIKRTVRKLLY